MIPSRETIIEALVAKLQATGVFRYVGRRVLMIGDVAQEQMPYLFVLDTTEDWEHIGRGAPPKRTIGVDLWCYCWDSIENASTSTTPPMTQLNFLLDKIEEALDPDKVLGVQTLNGLVFNAWIEGRVTKVPGDLDGKGLLNVPIKLLVP